MGSDEALTMSEPRGVTGEPRTDRLFIPSSGHLTRLPLLPPMFRRLPACADALRLWEASGSVPADGLAALLAHQVRAFVCCASGSLRSLATAGRCADRSGVLP